jgi:hypothetical protein
MALEGWLRHLEERLDPTVLFQRFLDGKPADDWQREALLSTASTIALRVCRQAGKSCFLATRAVIEMRKPSTTTLVLCPAERQAKEIARKVREYLLKTDLRVERSTLTEIELSNGSRLVCVPATGATIRGYTVTLLLVDEAAFIRADGEDGDSDAITAVLPMLTDDGVAIFASTPAGRTGYFAELFSNKQPGIHRIVVKGTDIPRLAARCARLKAVLSPTKYRQEVLVEMLGAGTSYFDLSMIEKAISYDKDAIRLC